MNDKPAFVAPADPAQRPLHRRETARLLVLDPHGRVLLFRDHDPMVPDFSWWNTPGGGVDPGETALQAAVREMHEETGFVVSAADLLGPIATRWVTHGYSDCVVRQHDTFFAVRVPAFEVDPSGLTAAEQVMMIEHRWWDLADLVASGERVWPAEIVELCALAGHPEQWPRLLADAEESSVEAVRGHQSR